MQVQNENLNIFSCGFGKFIWILLPFCVLLFISTVILATFLGLNLAKQKAQDKNELPVWPGPSDSALGVYYKAAVAADNGFCSEIGRDALLSGGNAVDAAIATAVCIGVMDAHSSGLGGGHFMTIYNSTTKSCLMIDAREEAPQAATMNMYKNNSQASLAGWLAVGVPGELYGMWKAHQLSGSLPWASLLEPTIRLLWDGYSVSPALAKALQRNKEVILSEPTFSVFVNNQTGRLFEAGEIMKRPILAKTLSLLANSTDPVALFYHYNGSIANAIEQEFAQNGGIITANDLHRYKPIVREPVLSDLPGGLGVCSGPPPSSGSVAAAIVKYLAGFGLSASQNLSTTDENVIMYHRMIESMKFAYASRSLMGDTSFGPGNRTLAENITSDLYASWVRSRITERAHAPEYYASAFSKYDHGTAHVSVLDAFGNAVSMTSTINLYFGAKRRSLSTGIIWNDEMDDFSTPGDPNYFAFPASDTNFIYPGKRPMSSMSPLIVTDKDSGQVRLVVGGAGGSQIISSSAYVALRALWFGETIKEAIDAPRLHDQWLPPATSYESGFPQAYVNALKDRGQNMTEKSAGSVITGIVKSSDGTIYANSDYRKGSTSYTAGY